VWRVIAASGLVAAGMFPVLRSKDQHMLKFTAATLLVFAAATPTFAADKLACNDDGMMKVEMMMKEKMAMKADTAMAMKENDMAMMAKKDGKMDDCAMHLNMAQEELMKKN
jgi:hypothetical protein